MASAQDIEVRRLAAVDVADFRDIRLAALKTAPDAFGSTYEEEITYPPIAFEDRLRATAIFGAYADGKIVGIAGFARRQGRKDAHKGMLWGMFVDPSARGRGVGAVLVDAVMRHACSVVEQVTLNVVTDNASAIALYKAAGFEIYGLEKRALKTDRGYADEMLMVRYCGPDR